MFDLGFREDIAKIMQKAGGRRQTMLFSATLSEEVLGLSERYMNDPAQVFLAPDKMTVEGVEQTVFAVDQPFKTDLLVEVLKREKPARSIVFTRTKIGADRLAMRLNKRRLPAHELHSGLHQKRRERILADFREGKFQYLIATDVAARGIDIDGVSHVINYDIPEQPEDYVHRIGRTGRMGATGRAVTFVTGEDGMYLTAIEKLINQEIRPIRYDGVRTQEKKAAEKKVEPKAPAYIKTLNGYIRKRNR
jgi:ATP-dependent RNA helicase DeaD